jgi:cysteine desulfurase/selenocysteine lyase
MAELTASFPINAVAQPLRQMKPGEECRELFPIFAHARKRCAIKGQCPDLLPLAYLDTAASSQKPKPVIERLTTFLSQEHANIHRGAYALSANATIAYEHAREVVAQFLGAKAKESVVFTKGATEAINLVASSYCSLLPKGTTLMSSVLEHHSNIVPWQMAAQRHGLQLEYLDVSEQGVIDLDAAVRQLRIAKPKLLAITHTSNALGTVVPLAELIAEMHQLGGKVLVDASQAAAHCSIDVAALNPDFLVFSGHKVYGPTGIGVLYAKKELLQEMGPYQGGGDMIQTVSLEGSTWAEIPHKFEAGTPPIAEAIGLAVALELVASIGFEAMEQHERSLMAYTFERMKQRADLTLYGPGLGAQSSIISFNVKGIHPHDLSSVADSFNVQLRAGHHCAMPLLKRLGVPSTARISFGMYSTREDVDMLLRSIEYSKKLLG